MHVITPLDEQVLIKLGIDIYPENLMLFNFYKLDSKNRR
jgi:hypothetical protein